MGEVGVVLSILLFYSTDPGDSLLTIQKIGPTVTEWKQEVILSKRCISTAAAAAMLTLSVVLASGYQIYRRLTASDSSGRRLNDTVQNAAVYTVQ